MTPRQITCADRGNRKRMRNPNQSCAADEHASAPAPDHARCTERLADAANRAIGPAALLPLARDRLALCQRRDAGCWRRRAPNLSSRIAPWVRSRDPSSFRAAQSPAALDGPCAHQHHGDLCRRQRPRTSRDRGAVLGSRLNSHARLIHEATRAELTGGDQAVGSAWESGVEAVRAHRHWSYPHCHERYVDFALPVTHRG